MLDFDDIAIDPALADEGIWVPFLSNSMFLLARPGEEHQSYVLELYQEHMELIKSGTPEGNEKAAEIYRRAAARYILKDWKGVVSKGVEVPYSEDKAYLLLSDPRHAEFQKFIETNVNNRANFREKVINEVAEDVKDSAVS